MIKQLDDIPFPKERGCDLEALIDYSCFVENSTL